MRVRVEEGRAAGWFGLPFFLFGLALAVLAWWDGVEGTLKARSWPAHDSEILVSQVGWDSTAKNPEPVVVYAYRVDGRDYLSSRHTFFRLHHFTPASSEAFVKRYPVGRRQSCHVDPADARRAVLDPRWLPLDVANLSVAAFSGLFVAFGLGSMVSALASKRTASKE